MDELPTFEPGGPRRRLYFEPGATRVAIVTCGGLCPGLNDVIRGLVLELHTHYGIGDVVGFRHGFAGLVAEVGKPPRRADAGVRRHDQPARWVGAGQLARR